jgi:hypothetical protein
MRRSDLLRIGLLLLALAVALHVLHVILFRNLHDTLFYLALDVAFLPLNVLFITLIVEQLLSERERQSRRHKMNMVIGAFFSAVGQHLIGLLAPLTTNREALGQDLGVGPGASEADLQRAITLAQRTSPQLSAQPTNLLPVRDFLAEHRGFLLGLLENPTLLEHERFTDLLWAVFHLQEELSARRALDALSAPDLRHVNADAERACGALLVQWLEYLLHLQRDYPYLFSFAARTNPWRTGASAEIE